MNAQTASEIMELAKAYTEAETIARNLVTEYFNSNYSVTEDKAARAAYASANTAKNTAAAAYGAAMEALNDDDYEYVCTEIRKAGYHTNNAY